MVSEAIFLPAESPYAHTTDALWTLWKVFDRALSSAVLSGTYADKAGYHNKRNDLPNSDYSSGRDVQNDDEGPGDKAAGLDVSMSEAQMILVTNRFWAAAQNNDPRLKWNGEYILREFIGTRNGTTVHCWVFTGGIPLGVGANQGSDPGRGKSHLWHKHYSVIRKFLNNMPALMQIGSIAVGESVSAWRERIEVADYTTTEMRAFPWQYVGGGIPTGMSTLGVLNEILLKVRQIDATVAAMAPVIATIATKVDIDENDLTAIRLAAKEGATESAQAVIMGVLDGLPPTNITKQDVEQAMRDVLLQGVQPE